MRLEEQEMDFRDLKIKKKNHLYYLPMTKTKTTRTKETSIHPKPENKPGVA